MSFELASQPPRIHSPSSHSTHTGHDGITPPVSAPSISSKRAVSTSYEPVSLSTAENDPVIRHHRVNSPSGGDIEGQELPHYDHEKDPYQLSSGLKSPSEINLIRANTSRKRDNFGPIALNKEAKKAKKLQNFYEDQNENIHRLLKPVDEHIQDTKDNDAKNHLKYQIALHGSFWANVCLAVVQFFGAASSGSLAVISTLADALFDPISNFTLIMCHRAIKSVDARRFPSGKARIETAGNIVFCFLMTAVAFVIMALSIRELLGGRPTVHGRRSHTTQFHLTSIVAITIAIGVKLALFFYCYPIRNDHSQIRIIWEDHRNDLFVNVVGLLSLVGGMLCVWWIDPVGAIIIGLGIAIVWLRSAYREFLFLVGITADTSMQQWITYISMTHSPMITAIDTVRAYYSGPRIIVEVDVVMAPEETLRATHDVAEELQMKLESLPDVERAYVHIDFETSHKPEHSLKKVL